MCSKKMCICSRVLVSKGCAGGFIDQRDASGLFLEFDWMSFDAWFDSVGVVDCDYVTERCVRISGVLPIFWSVDSC